MKAVTEEARQGKGNIVGVAIEKPLVLRWSLIVIDIYLFWIVLLLDPQGF